MCKFEFGFSVYGSFIFVGFWLGFLDNLKWFCFVLFCFVFFEFSVYGSFLFVGFGVGFLVNLKWVFVVLSLHVRLNVYDCTYVICILRNRLYIAETSIGLNHGKCG